MNVQEISENKNINRFKKKKIVMNITHKFGNAKIIFLIFK